MSIKKFNVTTSKLNLFKFPEFIKKNEPIEMKVNLNLEFLDYEKNEQKVILTYNLKSFKVPIHILWECDILLVFSENLNENIDKNKFFEYSKVIDVIDKEIELVSRLSDVRLPLLSETIGD